MTPRRTALVVLATAGLLFLAVMLFGGAHDPVVGPAGAAIMSAFATGCAVNAACAARQGQRFAWIALATGLGGWALGECPVVLRRSARHGADLGFLCS